MSCGRLKEKRIFQSEVKKMEELIKRLERVIQTGAPDKNGMHPISAETVLEIRGYKSGME